MVYLYSCIHQRNRTHARGWRSPLRSRCLWLQRWRRHRRSLADHNLGFGGQTPDGAGVCHEDLAVVSDQVAKIDSQ